MKAVPSSQCPIFSTTIAFARDDTVQVMSGEETAVAAVAEEFAAVRLSHQGRQIHLVRVNRSGELVAAVLP